MKIQATLQDRWRLKHRLNAGGMQAEADKADLLDGLLVCGSTNDDALDRERRRLAKFFKFRIRRSGLGFVTKQSEKGEPVAHERYDRLREGCLLLF